MLIGRFQSGEGTVIMQAFTPTPPVRRGDRLTGLTQCYHRPIAASPPPNLIDTRPSMSSSRAVLSWDLVSEGPWSRRRKHQAVVWESKIILLGGFDGESAFDLNDVWAWDESDGWEKVVENASWSGRDGHCAVVFNDKIFMMGGTDDPYFCKNDVWCSDNGGKTWLQKCGSAAWPERWQHAACVHNGKIFVMGGWGDRYLNDIWSSSDGKNWILVSAHAPWRPRMFLSAVSFKDAIYVIGGHDGQNQLRDVWASNDDGLTWIQVCQMAQWEGRQGHASVVVDDSVYLIGGFGGSVRFNDVWQSYDCSHWVQVCKRSSWSPRQGHACTYYKGGLYIMGGFDESGYCNNMYRLPLSHEPSFDLIAGSTDSIDEFDVKILGDGHHVASSSVDSSEAKIVSGSNINSSSHHRVITVSLETTLESISALRQARQEHDKTVQGILNIVALVTEAAHAESDKSISDDNFMLAASLDDFMIGEDAQEAVPSPHFDPPGGFSPPSPPRQHSNDCTPRADSSDRHRTRSADDMIRVEKRGSPLILSIMEAGQAACAKSAIRNDTDLNMQFWRTLPASSGRIRTSIVHKRRSEGGGSLPNASTGLDGYGNDEDNVLPFSSTSTPNKGRGSNITTLFSSAALRESMERDRDTLLKLQKEIRSAAEGGRLEEMNGAIARRTALAAAAFQKASMLSDYVETILEIQEARKSKLSNLLAKLEQLVEDLAGLNSTESTSSTCNWSEWLPLLDQCSRLPFEISSVASNAAIADFSASMKSLGNTTRRINEWVTQQPSGSYDSITELTVCFDSPATSLAVNLVEDFDSVMDSLARQRMKLKITSDAEIGAIMARKGTNEAILKEALSKGAGVVLSMLSRNSLDIIEMQTITREVQEWLQRTSVLKATDELLTRQEMYLADNSSKEENLLRLEDERIDARSLLEKASLKGSRRTVRSPETGGPAASPALPPIEELTASLALAEKRVKDARRDLRAWYRDLRSYSIQIAPELFHYLPDLQTPGSVLGDGGFAVNAKLPKRRLDEYDDITPFVVPGNSSSNSNSARHVLLKASYDGEEVILKGFIMNEGDQRKGFERETSILGRLKNDAIICPGAVVEDTGYFESGPIKVAIFIEYPYVRGGNLSRWLKAGERKPWELQGVARQLLYGIMYLHDHGVIHKDIKPSNVLMHEDGRLVLSDFELSKEVDSRAADNDEPTSASRAGTRGFMAPEVEGGERTVFASDMYSFGALLYFMYFPAEFGTLLPGSPRFPPNSDSELSDLITKLVVVSHPSRPSAASALMHPYFRSTFMERLLKDGEIVEQDRKLDAVRNLIHRARSDNRLNLEKITIRRDKVVQDVLKYFRDMELDKMRHSLRVTFVGEPGVDEGGLLTEMFTLFFESSLQGEGGLFVSSGEEGEDDEAAEATSAWATQARDVVLPNPKFQSPEQLKDLRAFGRSMVKALYEGRRMGSRLCPSVFKFLTDTSPNMRDLQMFDPQTVRSLQWMLATIGVSEYGLHFESIGAAELGKVTDQNKSEFVRLKIDRILVQNRLSPLTAIKTGFVEALKALSSEAAPFLSLLSHADWRILLCGDQAVNAMKIISCLKFTGFPKKSLVPQWLSEVLASSSEDHLRKFLVFVTGSPSLSSTERNRTEINVRFQPRSSALPLAHTCFFHLDIPDYRDKEILQSKLIYAIQNANTFEVV